ncbi:hypothetical protein [Terrabacter sp. Ter38]|uniref:hypothetical protein n=1 Tax=Terrabacter sp. Ter38 TaxID=2926030 RepID=UPI002117FBE3|nr:hypothetical protein [Terrabacter sp. Ter38]
MARHDDRLRHVQEGEQPLLLLHRLGRPGHAGRRGVGHGEQPVGGLVADLPAAAAGGPTGTIGLEFAGLVAVLAAQVVISGAQEPVFQDLSLRTEKDVLGRLGRLFVSPVRIEHLEDPDFLDRAQRVRSRVWEINQGLMQGGIAVTGVLMLVGATLSVGAVVGWPSAFLLVGATVGVAVARALLMRRELDQWVGATEHQRHAEYAFGLATGLATKEVRVFGLADWLGNRYWQRMGLSWKPLWRKRIHNSIWTLLLDGGRAAIAVGVVVHVVRGALSRTWSGRSNGSSRMPCRAPSTSRASTR